MNCYTQLQTAAVVGTYDINAKTFVNFAHCLHSISWQSTDQSRVLIIQDESDFSTRIFRPLSLVLSQIAIEVFSDRGPLYM